jgi:uncharacterized protein YecE (DUF72 family)
LEFYAARFDTVELNVTFYRMPTSATFRGWAARVPDGFTFAVKASRYLTHVRRLREPKEPVAFLMERAGELGSHLGPILIQLPPDMSIDLDRLAATLEAFPRSVRVAFEPRHRSWFTDGLRELLAEHGVALCLADRRGPLMPPWRTADWGYLRFHAGRARPASCYTEKALATWSAATHEHFGPKPTVYAYFNNDHGGCALRDAAVFGRLLADEGVEVARQPNVPDDVLRLPVRSA